jgi:hypothetical protein
MGFLSSGLGQSGDDFVECRHLALTRLILPPSKLRLLPISTNQATSAALRFGCAMSLRAASLHWAAALRSAPPPVKAFICFRMAARRLSVSTLRFLYHSRKGRI